MTQALRESYRRTIGRNPQPTAAIIDSQSVSRRLRWRAWDHPGDRGVFPPLGPATLLGAPHEEPRREGPDCIAHLRLPVTHRRSTRTTNLLERLLVEERRRLKIIPNGFGEKPVLKLMFGALVRAAERWRGLCFTRSSFVRLRDKGP